MSPIISKESLIEAIVFTKNFYFKNILNKKGKYTYLYLPDKNEKLKQYNILRHAGTTYSMLEICELIPDEELLKIAESAINFFIDKVETFDLNGKPVSAVIEKDTMKLGGNALGIIMLAKYVQITEKLDHLILMQRMARWICQAQDKNGNFIIQKQKFSTKEFYDFTSDYYPGEAILSLVRLYEIDGNKDWLNSAELAADYLIKARDKDKDIDTILHDHWLLYGLNELYKFHPKKLYLNQVRLITQSIIKSQIVNHENPGFNGAYRIPHMRLESTPTACRSEGLCVAYRLFHESGYDDEAKKIIIAIDQGIRFQLQTQLRPESVVTYKNKMICLGAFKHGLTKSTLRIDFTQHNISSIIAYYKIMQHAHD
ncbi:hypothetical protein E9840_07730 [Tissierella creatinini]|nr:hypothetical protein E9840_07730 [Tissierella creatinini]TJX61558.1 hypothetical protein E8P77_18265 [Soehngenia saccharolytica]